MSKSITLPVAPAQVQDSQDQDDLHIVEYLNQDNLPELLRLMLSQASTPAEADMLLMSTLTATSAVLPNLYFRYGKTGKKYYANLQCFILAAAYKMIEGDKAELVPAIEMNCQKQMLYERLGAESEHRMLVEEAKAQGIPQSTALRWSSQWIEKGLIKRVSHGQYKKTA